MSFSNCCDVPLGYQGRVLFSRLFLCLGLRKDAISLLVDVSETVQCVVCFSQLFY